MEGLIEDKRLLVLDLIDMSFLTRNEIIVPVVSKCHCTCETVHTTHEQTYISTRVDVTR